MNKRLDGPQNQSARSEEEKNLFSSPEFEPWTIQPVACHDNNYAIPVLLGF